MATEPATEQSESTEVAIEENINEEGISTTLTYPIVDTRQGLCYDDSDLIDCPAEGEPFFGQDAQYTGNKPSYTDNGDGTITDNVTGLVWQKSPDTNGDGSITATDKLAYSKVVSYCESLSLAGHDDWQLPTIKQLYSLMNFTGVDPSGYEGTDTSGLIPFIDTNYFDFAYGDTSANERIIDSQYASSNFYVGNGEQYIFGVNFADGRIKGYGISLHGRDKTLFVSCIRANSTYGVNAFVDNGDETITDNATGLMWAKNDSGSDAPNGLTWEEALAYVKTQNAANYLGYSDWRLPNIKELQGILDYSRSPDTTNSGAIDPLFNTTPITNETGQTDYSFYWSGTTHANWTDAPGSAGAYVSFGRAMGYMESVWQDVHGAGAQRSDPKAGDPADYPEGNGPQGDAIRIYNAVRLVRGGNVTEAPDGDPSAVGNPVISSNGAVQSTVVTTTVSQPGGPGGEVPDLSAAATKLGITEDALKAALGDPSQGPPDFATAAATLGITEAELKTALGVEASAVPTQAVETTQATARQEYAYPLVETRQGNCYDANGAVISCPAKGEPFYGQDAQFTGNAFSFTNNGDGTISDNVTSLMWQKAPNPAKLGWQEAVDYCDSLEFANQSDWRTPSLKELFSISNFAQGWPYLDRAYFDLSGRNVSKDEQYWSNNHYAGSTVEGRSEAAFGVNHGTGHIKAYPAVAGPMGKLVRCVRGDTYGVNQFVNNGDGTISDQATGLMWSQTDSSLGMDWESALTYAQTQNAANYLGHNDWRLPNVKELQSIVDYTRAPNATNLANEGPAIDPMFQTTGITNEAGVADYPYYWTSTSALFQAGNPYYYAWYVAFGRAVNAEGLDFHGAGAVRFDTKVEGGPAGEGGERYFNYVRLVRGGDVTETPDGDPTASGSVISVEFTDNGLDDPAGAIGGPPDLAAAADQLGITEDALKAALGEPGQGPPDLAAAAQALGVTEAELMAALGLEEGSEPPSGQPPASSP